MQNENSTPFKIHSTTTAASAFWGGSVVRVCVCERVSARLPAVRCIHFWSIVAGYWRRSMPFPALFCMHRTQWGILAWRNGTTFSPPPPSPFPYTTGVRPLAGLAKSCLMNVTEKVSMFRIILGGNLSQAHHLLAVAENSNKGTKQKAKRAQNRNKSKIIANTKKNPAKSGNLLLSFPAHPLS